MHESHSSALMISSRSGRSLTVCLLADDVDGLLGGRIDSFKLIENHLWFIIVPRGKVER